MNSQQIRPGAHVYIGAPGPRKLHWEVVEVWQQTQTAHLVSPFSGQRRREPIDRLTPHTPSDRKADA